MWTWTIVLAGAAIAIGLLGWLIMSGQTPEAVEDEFFRSRNRSKVAALRLTYVDRVGERTERDVVVFKIYPRLRKFDAFCRLRQDQRTFYFEGVEEAVDLASGEIIPDVGAFFKRR